jgi:hypothetical protein
MYASLYNFEFIYNNLTNISLKKQFNIYASEMRQLFIKNCGIRISEETRRKNG